MNRKSISIESDLDAESIEIQESIKIHYNIILTILNATHRQLAVNTVESSTRIINV